MIVGYPYRLWSDIFKEPRPSHHYHVYRFRDRIDVEMKFSWEKVVTKLYVLPDLEIFNTDIVELRQKYRYRENSHPPATIWEPKQMSDYPAWFGTGIRHIGDNGASLY
jgi:hypothetical protein